MRTLTHLLLTAALLVPTVTAAVEHVIVDTDLGSDADDSGTMAMMHALADRGEIEILAFGIVNGHPDAVACADAINTYYGRPDIPIGTIKGPAPFSHDFFASGIAREYPHDLTQAMAPDVVALYRSILAAQPDGSVTLVAIGPCTNISNLLKSGPDAASSLSGVELVRRKLKLYVAGGNGPGNLPLGDAGFNYQNDLTSAQYELLNMPVEIPLVESGGSSRQIPIGNCYVNARTENIARRCYEMWHRGSTNLDRYSADQLRVLYAVRPASRAKYWLSENGDMWVDGRTIGWAPSPDRNRHYALVHEADRAAIKAEMEELMMHEPTGVVPEPPSGDALRINFQPAGTPVPADFRADTGAIFGDRGNGLSYGWLGAENPDARDRNVVSDQRYDTFTHLQKNGVRTWEIAVPNGNYVVHLVMGDPAYADQTSNVFVEGVRLADPDGIDHIDEYTTTVAVADGRLTITPDANLRAGAKICFIEVTPAAPATNQAPTVSAGPDVTITLPGTASLVGTVTDDGLPAGSSVTQTWTTVSGPGTVTFANAGAVDTTASFSAAGTYVLRLTASDTALSASDEVQVVVNAAGDTTQTNSIVREYWNNIGGNLVSAIPVGTPPSGSDILTRLEAPRNFADYFGSRIRGYLIPPTTGSYVFLIASDDNSELWLSTSADPAQKQLRASVSGHTNVNEWTKYPTQRSVAIDLVAGQRYYLEVLHKDGNGADHVAVGWLRPGQTGTGPSEIIPGTALSQYDPAATTPNPTLDVTSLVLRGIVSGGTLTIDGQPITVGSDGTWAAEVELRGEAQRVVELVAEGAGGVTVRQVVIDEVVVPTAAQ